MLERLFRTSPLGIAMAMLLAFTASGCHGRLAQKQEYFSPTSAVRDGSGARTERVLRYHQAAQAARRACNAAEPVAADIVSARAAWLRHCATTGRSRAAHGGLSNAFDRWVNEEVRQLPTPTETAASVGGGS